jgi:hypothetical protein
MKRFLVALVMVTLAGCAATTSAPTPAPAFGAPFLIDGWSVRLNWLRRVEDVRPDLSSLQGTQMWVLNIDATNQTGGEARAGDGYRVQGTNGDIVTANIISIVDPVFGADLAAGGKTSGSLTFNLPLGDTPAFALVAPGSGGIQVPVVQPTPTVRPSAAITPTGTPGRPTPSPAPTEPPANLVFGSTIRYPTSVCMAYGYAQIPLVIKVTNKGGMTSDYIWFKIGDLGALAGAKLVDASWSGGRYIWDQSILSASMGYLFVRGPQVKAHQSLTLKFSVQTIDIGLAQYDVVVLTGPETIATGTDLTPAGTDYGPLSTTMSFC